MPFLTSHLCCDGGCYSLSFNHPYKSSGIVWRQEFSNSFQTLVPQKCISVKLTSFPESSSTIKHFSVQLRTSESSWGALQMHCQVVWKDNISLKQSWMAFYHKLKVGIYWSHDPWQRRASLLVHTLLHTASSRPSTSFFFNTGTGAAEAGASPAKGREHLALGARSSGAAQPYPLLPHHM